jgi:thioredoxin-like negative regulator of GroEL
MEKNYNITSYPTVIFIKDKVKVAEHVGLNPKPLEGILNTLLAQVDAEKAASEKAAADKAVAEAANN